MSDTPNENVATEPNFLEVATFDELVEELQHRCDATVILLTRVAEDGAPLNSTHLSGARMTVRGMLAAESAVQDQLACLARRFCPPCDSEGRPVEQESEEERFGPDGYEEP